MTTKWVHFIGIAGVTTGQLAVEYKNQGWVVTGSDKGLFPPMSDYIISNGINIEIGYKNEHLEKSYYVSKYNGIFQEIDEHPDLIIAQGSKGKINEEYVYAENLNIQIKYFPEIIHDYVIKPEGSIVVAGTYGKSTITSMLVQIFKEAQVPISYMFGALSSDLGNGVKFNDEKTLFSIVEGDEYIESFDNPVSKFFQYSPKYLIITGLKWDHTDVFKTKDDYVNNFANLVRSVPKDGLIIVNDFDELNNEVIKQANCEVKFLSDFEMKEKDFGLTVIGKFNQINALFAYAIAKSIGIKESVAIKALEKYKGIKRRLEVKHSTEKFLVIDDFGASAPKAKISIETLKNEFTEYKIYAIFEPNIGSRTRQGIEEYKEVFLKSDLVFLPRFTRVSGEFITANELCEYLFTHKVNCVVELNDDNLLESVISKIKESEKSIVVFLGSHGFRGMIDNLIKRLKSKE